MHIRLLAAGLAMLAPALANPALAQGAAPAVHIAPSLISLKDALSLAQGSLDACAKRGETAAVFVTDADGYLRVALSADGMNPIGLSTARLKTATVLEFHMSTRDVAAKLAADPDFKAKYEKDSRFFFHPGALPLFRDGKFVGVLAIGGGHDKDEACGLDAVAALPWARVKP